MRTPSGGGTLVLMGGDEFQPDCRPADRHLLSLVGRSPARVAIVPTAAATENPRLAAGNGVAYFEALGATASPLMVLTTADAAREEYSAEVLSPALDLVYLPGGSPSHLLRTLKGSPFWESLRRFYLRGGILVGSSAGAMVLGSHMLFGPTGWTEALGLAGRLAVLPHHGPRPQTYPHGWRQGLAPAVVVLGIPAATACLRRGASPWQVLGGGPVTLYAAEAGGRAKQYSTGTEFSL